MRVFPIFFGALAAATVAVARADVHEAFLTTPFDRALPRWCERYHHGHWIGASLRLTRSRRVVSECAAGGRQTSLSCTDPGCDSCAKRARSPCAKVGDRRGNAVVQTARDHPGRRRAVTALFRIERQLGLGDSHLALYAALHPHCHTTAQAILVPDRPGRYHLNVAAFNQFIGGNRRRYRICLTDPMNEISPPLASEIRLDEDVPYEWTLWAELDANGRIVATSTVTDEAGNVLGTGHHGFRSATATSWFGVAEAAARYGFGAQFGSAPGRPAVRLLRFDGVSR
jgi:hypothetical protein